MTDEQRAALQVIWETLNGLIYDIENYNDLSDLGQSLIDCRDRIEQLGVGQ